MTSELGFPSQQDDFNLTYVNFRKQEARLCLLTALMSDTVPDRHPVLKLLCVYLLICHLTFQTFYFYK